MPSSLYRAAVAYLLDDERNALAALEIWLETVTSDLSGRSNRPVQGSQVSENLRAECHFLGDGDWGDPKEFTVFLKLCAEEHARWSSDPERYIGYEGQCTAHQGKGLRINRADLPSQLLRYVRSRDMVARLVEKILGRGAKADFQRGRLTIENALRKVASSWDAPGLIGRIAWAQVR